MVVVSACCCLFPCVLLTCTFFWVSFYCFPFVSAHLFIFLSSPLSPSLPGHFFLHSSLHLQQWTYRSPCLFWGLRVKVLISGINSLLPTYYCFFSRRSGLPFPGVFVLYEFLPMSVLASPFCAKDVAVFQSTLWHNHFLPFLQSSYR